MSGLLWVNFSPNSRSPSRKFLQFFSRSVIVILHVHAGSFNTFINQCDHWNEVTA